MTTDEFAQILENRVEQCKKLTLGVKDREYSRNNDKLWNFRRAGQILRIEPERALLGMMSKHFASVLDIVNDELSGITTPRDTFDEKFSDLHNYLFLLEAILKERKREELIKCES
jgi:hypothetical protein